MFALKTDVLAVLLPSDFLLFIFPLRKDIRLHTASEQTLVFLKVTYVDLILKQFLPAFDFEVKPLQMSSSITIDSHETVILSLSDFEDAVEVAAFEEGVEDEFFFGLPVLSAERSVGEFHVVWGFDMRVRESKRFVIPSVVGILVARA